MTYSISLSDTDLQAIYRGLGELKLKEALITFGSIQAQVEKQLVPPAAEPPAP